MATTDRPRTAAGDATSEASAQLAEADLVQLVTVADGDCLAAAGLLAAACRAVGLPYQVSMAQTADEIEARLAGSDEAATAVLIGTSRSDVTSLDPKGPVSPLVYELAGELGGNPDAGTALAGVVAAGEVPSQVAPTVIEAAEVSRVSGFAVPGVGLADGLAHSGLIHASFSGDPEAAAEALSELGIAERDADELPKSVGREVASMVALTAGSAPDATDRAALTVEGALRPYRIEDGAFGTVAGTADVLSALAERAPGLAIALALGTDGRDEALDHWRARGRDAHAAVREADTARYSGVFVVRTDGPTATVARLVRDYRSPEPVVLAVGDGMAAASSIDDPVGGPLGEAAAAAGGSALARDTRGTATFDPDRTERFVEAFREAR